MKKITSEQFNIIRSGFRKPRPKMGLMKIIEDLNIGEGLIVERHDWSGNGAFSSKVHSVFGRGADGRHYTVKTLDDNKGWAVLRTD